MTHTHRSRGLAISRQFQLLAIALSLICYSINAFHINSGMTTQWMKPSISYPSRIVRPCKIRDTRTSSLKETVSNVDKPVSPIPGPVDFTQFAVGQQYEASPLSLKKFGAFVDIGKGVNVLLPRSLLSNYAVQKLQKAVEENSQEKVSIELVGVSAENRTLSGKLTGDKVGKRDYRSKSTVVLSKDLVSKSFNATIVSIHDFGCFASIDELGADGLIPISKLSYGTTKANIRELYTKGMTVVVTVESVNEEGKKMVLSSRGDDRIDVTRVMPDSSASDKWVQGVVQGTASFGLFIRPAGMDAIGLLHYSRIPRDLMSAVKKISPIAPGLNKTDVEALFSAGDIFKVRIHSINKESNKMELSALPYVSSQSEEDEYVIIEDEDEEKEGKEGGKRRRDDGDIVADDSMYDDLSGFNPLSVLVWWKGKAFETAAVTPVVSKDEEAEVVTESRDVIEGTWRRLFELDMRADEADFSAKAMEAEIRELEEEIGELSGLDEDLGDAQFGLGTKFGGNRIGANIALSALPSEWRDQVEFFKSQGESEKVKSAGLKGGKKFEQSELEAVFREIESDNERASSKSRRPVINDVPVVAPVEVVAVIEPTDAVVPPETL